MRTAILYIAERCNQECVFCLEMNGAWKPFVDPATSDVMHQLEHLYGRGARQITFMGGETFFRKDLPDIIKHAKSLGFSRVGVTTNGTVLSKKGFIQNLLDSGLDFIELSVHGHTAKLANAIGGTAFSHTRQADAMAEVNKLGKPSTIVNVVVCQENKDQLVAIAEYVSRSLSNVPIRFKIKFVSIQGLAAVSAEQDGVGLRLEEVDPIPVGDFLAARGIPFWFWNVPLCRLGRHAAHSHETGVLAADETYFDYDHRAGLGYYDSGHQLEGHVWPKDRCGSCTLRPICPGLEESYRRLFGTDALTTRDDDPLPVLAAAIQDRGGDPAAASARLDLLRAQRRPSRAEIQRLDPDIVRYRHSAEPQDLEISVVELSAASKVFIKAGRFGLSYVPWQDDPEMARRERVAEQLQIAGLALQEANVAGVTLKQALASVRKATAPGWTCQTASCDSADRPAAVPGFSADDKNQLRRRLPIQRG